MSDSHNFHGSQSVLEFLPVTGVGKMLHSVGDEAVFADVLEQEFLCGNTINLMFICGVRKL